MTSEQQGELRAFLRSYVAKPGWSVKRLAEEADMHSSSLYNFLDNEKKRLGHSVLNRLAPIMGMKPEELHRLAGLLPRPQGEDADAKPTKSEARRKVDALFDMLSPEEQEQAIEILETFRKRREAEIKAASQRRLKRS